MFSRILIANRGEIACRVIETCRDIGVKTVAVYSDADAQARHVAMADQAVQIGGAAPTESYLDQEKVIEAAKASGAEAIHPGYGFLSENPDFVDAVEAAGLVFIGPSADAIRAMGLKDAAKRLMTEAGVPVVPGYHGQDLDPVHLAKEADAIGYPVLIKAVAGGGGKGMRLVEHAKDFSDALKAAQAEARGAFGNDAVLIEKFVEKPRHIEVQIFGDGTKAVHLFERDCSLQRRHQKVVEEAPAPGMTDEMRAAMGAAAVRAAEAIGYAGAGTVEFIVDASKGLRPDGFWFMEMNTRLQVEHPVTEAITGVDLVEWQLQVASGEPLPAKQDDLSINGHAMEVRLYAEDVPAGFLPATGTLTHLAFPGDVRIDTGVRAGDAVTPYYDPMIAKITTHGRTREEARAKLVASLAATEVAGVTTNHGFLRKLINVEAFVSGDVDTGVIDRADPVLLKAPVPCTRSRSLGALGALGLAEDLPKFSGFSLWQPLTWKAHILWEDEPIEVAVQLTGPRQFTCRITDKTHVIERRADGWWADGDKIPAKIVTRPDAVSVFWGNGYHFTVPNPLNRSSQVDTGGTILSPMPGLVRDVFVKPGASVTEGDRLAIFEAMKMEHLLTAPRDGRISEVFVSAGDQVEAQVPILALEDDG